MFGVVSFSGCGGVKDCRTSTVSGGALHSAEKNLSRGRFSKFSRSTKKKRRLGNAEPRSTEARRQMLLTTSWSHTSQAGIFWGIRLSN